MWGWEPKTQYDSVEANWPRLADLSVHDNTLLGGSFHNSFVGVWVVKLGEVAPFGVRHLPVLPLRRRPERRAPAAAPPDSLVMCRLVACAGAAGVP